MKIFKIDEFIISIEEDLFNTAIEYYVISDDSKEIYAYLKNAIRAGSCYTDEDLKNFSYEKLRKEKTDKDISESVKSILIQDIRLFGGKYDN